MAEQTIIEIVPRTIINLKKIINHAASLPKDPNIQAEPYAWFLK
jgi:hypothetical protein